MVVLQLPNSFLEHLNRNVQPLRLLTNELADYITLTIFHADVARGGLPLAVLIGGLLAVDGWFNCDFWTADLTAVWFD